MRIAAIIVTALVMLTACLDQPENSGDPAKKSDTVIDTSDFTTIQWIDSARDFGKIDEGQKLDVSFRYKNTGSTPLVIYMVRPSCGCTLAEAPGKPVAPGETGEIKAMFNSEGREGINNKEIYVDANTKGSRIHHLQFRVEVMPKK